MVQSVTVPVTLKIRTGIDSAHRNAPQVSAIAQRCGVAALVIHGRTRADLFSGRAEFESLRSARAQLSMPLIANGDIDSAASAREVLDLTGAEGVMIGRAAQGSPWIFRDVNAYLATGEFVAPLLRASKTEIILQHLESLYEFYGEYTGLRMARKHLGWYCRAHSKRTNCDRCCMAAESSASQFATAKRIFEGWARLKRLERGEQEDWQAKQGIR